MSQENRRSFLKQTGAGLVGVAALRAARPARALGANDKIVMAAIGCGGQGSGLARSFAGREGVELRIDFLGSFDVDVALVAELL